MKRKIINAIFAFLLLPIAAFALVFFPSCGGEDEEKVGEHTIDKNGIGGKGILDDGGDINFSDPVEAVVGVKTDGEHRIIIGENKDLYELAGDAVDTATWSNSGCTVKRIRCGASASVIFTLDFGGTEDASKVGFMMTLINSRTYTCISVSADKNNWTDIGYADALASGVKADYSEKITDMLGNEVADSNLYQCYYALGDYITDSKVLYIKAGYSDAYYTKLPSPTGTDVIGYVSYFDSFELEKGFI